MDGFCCARVALPTLRIPALDAFEAVQWEMLVSAEDVVVFGVCFQSILVAGGAFTPPQKQWLGVTEAVLGVEEGNGRTRGVRGSC